MSQTSPAQKGLITGVLMILASLLSFYVLKNPIESYFQFIVYFIFTGGIIWAIADYANKLAGTNKKFKDYFSTGFKSFVVVVLLMAVFTFIFFYYNTGFRDDKIAENNKLIIQQGNHLPNEIEANAAQLRKLFLPLMVSSAVFRYLIIGALVSAVTAGVLVQRESFKSQQLKIES